MLNHFIYKPLIILGGGPMNYLFEVFIGNLTVFSVLESFLFGIFISTSVYFFSKNKWGSILLSVPFSAIYLYVVYQYSFHIYFAICELLIQYLLIKIIRISECSLKRDC